MCVLPVNVTEQDEKPFCLMTGLVLSGSWFLSVVTCQIYLERASRKQVFHKLLHRKKAAYMHTNRT